MSNGFILKIQTSILFLSVPAVMIKSERNLVKWDFTMTDDDKLNQVISNNPEPPIYYDDKHCILCGKFADCHFYKTGDSFNSFLFDYIEELGKRPFNGC